MTSPSPLLRAAIQLALLMPTLCQRRCPHTTPIHRYVDDLTFTFVEGSDPTCLVDAYSVSETLSLLDYGTNYCNLFNLMDGSGLVNDPAFSEDTNNFICTQRSSADCDIY